MSTQRLEESGQILKNWVEETDNVRRRIKRAHDLLMYGYQCASPKLPKAIHGAWRQARKPGTAWYFMPITGFLHMNDLIWAAPYDEGAQGVLGDWLLEQGWILDATRESICSWATGIVSRLVFRHWWPKNQDWFLRSEGWFPWLHPPHQLFGVNREVDPVRLAGQQLVIYDEDIGS